ncbi:MAG: bifunctional phosphopantothenoylcysteine decarboxylase/phosphopantothenate--cysteine ligase CoaBC [Deltaproteobacteria bacterium]|nr:bifunctional phosphopantothenoylcysteine decarboxylase/phosphopantothenate--cysteine ligase CoaBC [Deltaproteobacteria bacterium]
MADGRNEKSSIVLGVTGGIACYKAVELVRLIVKAGMAVRVIMTRGAMEFVTPLTFQTLSGHPVASETFDLTQESEIGHINLADSADLFVIAPATANIIGKIANGIADDLLTTVLMATQAPVLLAPAMNIHMYDNPILQENLLKLRRVGYHVMEPGAGFLACGYEGKGRLPDPEQIFEEMCRLLKKKDLAGEKLLITAGPNREPIDPVRYISNRSSGKMGYAVARAALRRGAQVTLVSGPTALEPPAGARFLPVLTARQMLEAMQKEFSACSAVVMAAAVADYHVAEVADKKLKRGNGPLEIRLEPNPDILKLLGAAKDGKLMIGFAAETNDLIANAQKKLREKNLDMIVANDVTQEGSGFDGDTNVATLIDRTGATRSLPLMTKDELADKILDQLLFLKSQR